MSQLLFWVLLTLFEAAILHLASIWYFPRLLGRRAARKLENFAGHVNAIGYRGLPVAGRTALTTNPDMPTAFGVYDLAEGPVRVACVTPSWNSYWSVSLYSSDTRAFYVINDLTASASEFDLVIVPRNKLYVPRGNERAVISPTRRGVIVVRMVAHDRDDAQEIARIEQVIRKTVISGKRGRSNSVAEPVANVCES